MNVNITGIYDNTVIVDNNLFEDVRLLQTGLSSLSDTLFNVVEGLPLQYANLSTFTILSNDYDTFKINNTSNLSVINTDIDNLYQVKIKNWIIFLIVLFLIAIFVQITGLLIYYKKVATPLFDSRAVVSLVRFVLLLFILFRPKFLNESGYSAKITKIIRSKNNLSVSNFELLFFANSYFLNANANLEDFALKLNKTKGEVSAFIKDQFNDSFSEILNKNRVTYFKELLNSKQYESFTIEALSEMSGFSNRQAMYVAFKKYEGCTPSDYIDNL